MTQTMSVTRALVELKTLNDKINRAIVGGVYVGLQTGTADKAKFSNSNFTTHFASKVEAEGKIKGSFDSVESLVNRRQAIKSAIILSNANTNVTFGGKTITVAEAIELKSTVEFRKSFLINLQGQLSHATNNMTTRNVALEAKIDKLLETSYGSEKTKVDAAVVEAISKPQRDTNSVSLFDPLDIQSKIDSQRELLDQLESELDFTLSESNARTTIVV